MTNEELEQIGKLLETKLKAEREHTRKLVRDEVEASEKRLTKTIEQGNEQIIDILTHTADEILKQQNTRISHIEEHLGLDNPTNKN